MLSNMAAPVSFLQRCMRPQVPLISPDKRCSLPFVSALPVGVKLCPVAVLTCSSLKISDAELLFVAVSFSSSCQQLSREHCHH